MKLITKELMNIVAGPPDGARQPEGAPLQGGGAVQPGALRARTHVLPQVNNNAHGNSQVVGYEAA